MSEKESEDTYSLIFLSHKHPISARATIMLETANDLIAFKSLENNEIRIILTIKVTDYNDPQLAQRMDKYLEKIASESRMFAFEWTKWTEYK